MLIGKYSNDVVPNLHIDTIHYYICIIITSRLQIYENLHNIWVHYKTIVKLAPTGPDRN